ncbi:MAG: hypothetical protein ACYTDV_19370 [Planctomycetota bacterium]|jgi:hypothetical protein
MKGKPVKPADPHILAINGGSSSNNPERALASSRVLREHGIDPCPDRPERTTWNEFIKAHWDSLAAIDFFTTEVYTIKEFVRYMVLIVIDCKNRPNP